MNNSQSAPAQETKIVPPTQGPWEVFEGANFVKVVARGSIAIRREDAGYLGGPLMVADVHYHASDDYDSTPDLALANARLIAAAPDLLEALQNLAYYESRISPPPYGHKCRWCGDCVQRAKDEARTAIRKATGKGQ